VSVLVELNTLLSGLGVSVETGVFSGIALDEYVVITPLADTFQLFANNLPEYDQQEARISIYSKGNYLELKNKITGALLAGDFTITSRQYIDHEDDTKYHHYGIDVARIYPTEI